MWKGLNCKLCDKEYTFALRTGQEGTCPGCWFQEGFTLALLQLCPSPPGMGPKCQGAVPLSPSRTQFVSPRHEMSCPNCLVPISGARGGLLSLSSHSLMDDGRFCLRPGGCWWWWWGGREQRKGDANMFLHGTSQSLWILNWIVAFQVGKRYIYKLGGQNVLDLTVCSLISSFKCYVDGPAFVLLSHNVEMSLRNCIIIFKKYR